MDEEKLLIELLEDLSGSKNDDCQLDALLERCFSAPESELNDFFDDLSRSFGTYLPTLQTFISYLCNKHFRPKWNNFLAKFSSLLITVVITKNLHDSDTSGFGKFLHNCIDLLWSTDNPDNKDNNKSKLAFQSTKRVFSAILNENGVFGTLVSETYGYLCLKRVLFEFNVISDIEREELLDAVDIIVALVETCPNHENNDLPQLSENFSVYKACNALLETLRSHQSMRQMTNRNDSLPPTLSNMTKLDDSKESRTQHRSGRKHSDNLVHLSIKDEQHLALLEITAPQKTSDLPHFLRALEQRKTDLFQDLMRSLPCTSCYKQALVHFAPNKYSLEEESASSERLYRLPFEFDDSDKLGPWDILLSEDTIEDMRKLESKPDVVRIVMKKLGQISSGAWKEHKLQRKVQTYTIPVYEIELDNDGLKIFWQVDYGFSIRSNSLTQLVKIWAVTDDQKRIKKILENLSIVHQLYTSRQSYFCTLNKIGIDDIILPMTFGDNEEIKSSENGHILQNGEKMNDEKLLEVHKMLVTNKFVPLSTNLYKSLSLGGLSFTFQVSKKEHEIINSPTSAIIIGRSGTGKTTCVIFRQIASYLNNQLSKTPSSCDKRQIFITVSPILCRRVKEYFYKLRDSAILAGKKMSLPQFYEYRRKKEEEEGGEKQPIEEEEEEEELNNIPDSFRQLMDHHFPLFVTYDKFSKMLQGTYGINSQNLSIQKKSDADNIYSHESYQRSSFINTSNKNFVDYKAFHKRYWPRLKGYCQKFDCELVYAEFSIIKGSNPEVNCLSREDYKNVSTKKYPAFCYNRDQIYDLFQRYEKIKSQNGDYDSIDRTLAILRCAKKKALSGPNIHEVYIDECQDNQIVDLALVLKVFDRSNSIFFAGDIAQCIARGSSFRFQDLRALMYKWECSRTYNAIKPKQFELNINYRSHNGILQLASSVIDLIWEFFPNSIDRLSRERSEVGGPKPIIFDGFKEEHFKIFHRNEKCEDSDYEIIDYGELIDDKRDENIIETSDDAIEFGAEQVIIVRDEDTKLRVQELIGQAGMVMTVFETKGMEFNDVLLYNFFTDSPACRKWNIVLSALKEKESQQMEKELKKKDENQSFSHEKYYILSSELKHLYVAVTRARHHIWICDENTEYCTPIRKYWEDLELVEVTDRIEETISTLAKKSDSNEWNRKGNFYFEQRQYEQAKFCYKKSENKKLYELSNAYYLRQIARDSIDDSDDDSIKHNFIRAAEAFKECSRPNQAALCYQEISMYKKAIDIYVKWNMFEPAAHCYNKVKMWRKAAEYFEKAKNYTEAIVAYKNDGDYETVIDLMEKYRKKIDEKIFHRITRLVNIHYRRAENNEEMRKKALSILQTEEEQIELLKDHPKEFIEVCEKKGQFRVAAEDLRSHGKFEAAADKFTRSDNDEDTIEALQCLLHLCRVNVLKRTMIDTNNQNKNTSLQNLLSKAKVLTTKIKSQSSKESERWKNLMEEFRLYIAYINKDLSQVHKSIQFFRCRKDLVTEFRAVNVWLQIQQSDIQAEYWNERLQYLLRLCELAFYFIAPHPNHDVIKIKKDFEEIFFIREVENCPQKRQTFFDNPFVLIIDNNHDNNNNTIKDETETEIIVYDTYVVHREISKFLASYIFELIWSANLKGREIPDISFRICIKFPHFQKQHCRKHHVTPTPSILHQRLKLACLQYTVMLQLLVLYHRRLLKNEQSIEVRGLQRWWAERLVDTHIRYQSPQVSCPEVTYMVLKNLPKHTHNGFINLCKTWLFSELSKDIRNFEIMLKCIFFLQQLKDEWGINKFNWEMSKQKIILYNRLNIGFEHFNNYKMIPIGNRLSSFFSYLYSNYVIDAISNIKEFIQYAINNSQRVNLDSSDSFGDFVSLMEFTVSLIFAIRPGNCKIYFPRSYLVNYFETFTSEPLIPSHRTAYNREDYLSVIKNSFDQVQQLLDEQLICDEYYSLTIFRLIRLLILIGLNENTLSVKVLNFFNYLNKKFSVSNGTWSHNTQTKIKKYLKEKSIERLVNVMKNDLEERGCDSLVLVHYNLEDSSKISGSYIMKLSYNSIEGFHSGLQQLKSSVSEISENQYQSQGSNGTSYEQFTVPKETQKSATEVKDWFRWIHDLPQVDEKVTKIQVWFRDRKKHIENRKKSNENRKKSNDKKPRKINDDPTLNNTYNDMIAFCENIPKKRGEKGKKTMQKYLFLLRGMTVKVIVELIKLQGKMSVNKNKLQESIKNSSNTEKVYLCLELEDELKCELYDEVERALKSLSITENSEKFKKVNVEWLEDELQQAEDTINKVREWINKCKDAKL